MNIVSDIINIIKDWAPGFKFVAPYQENPADFIAGYATIFHLNSIPQTSVGESIKENSIELSQINALNFQISLYKFVNYSDKNTPEKASTYLRNMLNSYDAIKAFNSIGLDIGPQFSRISIDTYRDNERNKYVQHAHFEVTFYKKDVIIIESDAFTAIDISDKNIIGD